MPELTELTLQGAIRGLRGGDFSSRELVEACLGRIERLEPDLHCFLALTPESAIAQAEDADRRLAAWRKSSGGSSGDNLPPLLGVPLAVKDVLCVAGVPCTCGSRILESFIPPYNATAVERLQAAGAVILGKTNTDEFAMGSSTENSAYGVTHNPWDVSRVPGGSSGGSAAAVAAGLVMGALGTDTGGSVRQPAACCGVTGFKPTYGRVSRYGLVAFGSSLDTIGVLAHDVADAACIYSVIAGHDPRDSTCVDLPALAVSLESTPGDAPLRGTRIGVPREYFVGGLHADVEARVRAAIRALEDLGAEAREVSLPHTRYALPVYYLVAPAEASANLARYDGIRYGPRAEADTLWDIFKRTRGELFGPEVKRRVMLGTYALSAGYYDAYYGQAQKVRTLVKGDFDRAFQEVDVIAAPVTPTTAFRLGEHSDDPLAMYLEDIFTIPANLAGVPGLAFPVGFDRQGLPIGMQLIGPSFGEEILLRLAHAYQQVTDWHTRLPAIVSDS
jgi:aspartyl-tRNA(Asn)/glutamyl-tRNA(Gln) amidotransferase subunit A